MGWHTLALCVLNWEERCIEGRLFSHYKHPMRWYGRLIGRYLTLLVNLCPQHLPI